MGQRCKHQAIGKPASDLISTQAEFDPDQQVQQPAFNFWRSRWVVGSAGGGQGGVIQHRCP